MIKNNALNGWFKRLVGAAIFIAFVVLVEQFYGWSMLLALWRDVSPTAIATAVITIFVTYWLRALRLYDCYREIMQDRFLTCMKLMLIHNLLNNLLPMRTGEVSFPVLMARYFHVPTMNSVPVLLWLRMLDLHTLGGFALFLLGTHMLKPWEMIGLTLFWLVLLLSVWKTEHWLRKHWASSEGGRIRYILLLVLDAIPNDARTFWRVWAWTVASWGLKLAVFAWVLRLFLEASGAATTGAATVLAVAAGDLTTVLPVHGVAGTGTYEVGVATVLLSFGVNPKAALAASVNLHLFVFGSTLIGGAVSLLIPRVKSPLANAHVI